MNLRTKIDFVTNYFNFQLKISQAPEKEIQIEIT